MNGTRHQEASRLLSNTRQNLIKCNADKLDHYGYLMEHLIMQIAGLRDDLEAAGKRVKLLGVEVPVPGEGEVPQ